MTWPWLLLSRRNIDSFWTPFYSAVFRYELVNWPISWINNFDRVCLRGKRRVLQTPCVQYCAFVAYRSLGGRTFCFWIATKIAQFTDLHWAIFKTKNNQANLCITLDNCNMFPYIITALLTEEHTYNQTIPDQVVQYFCLLFQVLQYGHSIWVPPVGPDPEISSFG